MKNKTLYTDRNDIIDNLIYRLENSVVLSENFKQKIFNLSWWIVANHEKYIDEILTKLNDGLEFEINKNK